MPKFSFYEQVGILIPGALFLVVASIMVPRLNTLVAPEDFSLGKFGMFLIVSYACGHAVAAVGNLLESILWRIRGGMPSEWVIYNDDRILNAQQKNTLKHKVETVLQLTVPKIEGLDRASWEPVFRQIYRFVLVLNLGRVEIFNGNYGLNRGLMTAFLLLAGLSLAMQPQEWRLPPILMGMGIIFGYRMHMFGVQFAREVYLIFLNWTPPKAG